MSIWDFLKPLSIYTKFEFSQNKILNKKWRTTYGRIFKYFITMLCCNLFPKRIFRWCARLHYWFRFFNPLWNNLVIAHDSKIVILSLRFEPCDFLKSMLCEQICKKPWNMSVSLAFLCTSGNPSWGIFPKVLLVQSQPQNVLGSEPG